MHSVKLLPALLAFSAGLVSAQETCTRDIEISEPTPVINCEVIDADVIVSEDVRDALVINGPKQIRGNFVVSNVSSLVSISSTTINSIGGRFELNDLNLLSNLQLSSLRSLNEIKLVKLPGLNSLTFGTNGVTKAESVEITDTQIFDLSGLKLSTVKTLNINTNPQLKKFNSDLVNITESLIITGNGNNMTVTMEKLESAAEIQLLGVSSFDVPALTRVSKSIKFDKNPELESFEAANLTEIGESVTFINNKKLANISFPILTKLSGDMTIQNNTELKGISGFPELETVFGGIILRGDFEEVELPKLRDVRGAVTVTSTTDISDFCDFFNDAHEDGKIKGDTSCSSNNAAANEGGDEGEETESGNSGNSGNSNNDDDDEGAAGMLGANMAMLGLAILAGIAQLL